MTEPQPQSPTITRRILNWLSYGVAICTGGMVGDVLIRGGAYKNLAKTGIFNELQAKTKIAMKETVNNAAFHGPGEMAKRIKDIEEVYRQAVKGEFASRGLRNIKDYWTILQRNQKIETIVKVFGTAGIALGVMLTLTGNRGVVKSSPRTFAPAHEVEESVDTQEIGRTHRNRLANEPRGVHTRG